MDDVILKLIVTRLDRLESKVDNLLYFRGWVLGGVAAISAVVALAATYLTK